MSNKAYYKTNDAEVLAALHAHWATSDKIREAGNAFAASFGGKLIVANGIHGYKIAGLCFSPAKDQRLWTAPDDKNCGRQRPRASIKHATADEKAELKALQKKWDAEFPTEQSDFEPTLQAMGISWSDLIFTGFSMFEHGGYLYVATSAKLNDRMQEILASEYLAAKTESEKESDQ